MKRASHHIFFCNSVHVDPNIALRETAEEPRLPSATRLLADWNGDLDEDTMEALTEALRPGRHEVS